MQIHGLYNLFHHNERFMTNTAPETTQTAAKPQKESLLANLLFNIIIPTLILTKLSGDSYLGTTWSVVVALLFPIGYGLRDFIRTRKVNFFSALGVISVVFTGGIALLELDPKYIAIKEATIPALFGIATVVSLYTPYPLVKTFLYNDKILQVERISEALRVHRVEQHFEKVLRNASYMIAASFFLSSLLNYILAKVLLVSAPGSEAFNQELGKMTALSFPVIALPATAVMVAALIYLFKQIRSLTELDFEEIFNQA